MPDDAELDDVTRLEAQDLSFSPTAEVMSLGVAPMSLGSGNVFTVGTGEGGPYDYASPANALADTGNVRSVDRGLSAGEPWVMELHEDFVIKPELKIPASMDVTIRSVAGKQYALIGGEGTDNINRRVIGMYDAGAKLTLADVVIREGYHGNYGAGIFVDAASCELILNSGTVIKGNNVGGNYGGGGICVYTKGTNSTVTVNAGASISENDAFRGAGISIYSASCTLTVKSGASISNNTGGSGGGIYSEGGAEIIVESGAVISGNVARHGYGGAIYVLKYSNLTMKSGAVISGNSVSSDTESVFGGGVSVGAASTLTMAAGAKITNNRSETESSYSVNQGGGVYVEGGSLIMNGGEISGNTGTGGGVYVRGGSLIMNGGEISGNTCNTSGGGVYLYEGSSFTMKAGSILNNSTPNYGYGGGVYVRGGSSTSGSSFTMEGGTISGNRATYGGGVSVEYGSTFVMKNGAISSNLATGINSNNGAIGNGGGVSVGYMHGSSVGKSSFTMDGGEISYNEAQGNEKTLGGGGVYVGSESVFTLNAGKIAYNKALCGGGVLGVADIGSTGTDAVISFVMNGGEISYNRSENNADGTGIFLGGGGVAGGIVMNGGTISHNTSTTKGGGILGYTGFELYKGTISDNTAQNGGGMLVNNYALSNDYMVRMPSFMKNGMTISNNTAERAGGGVYIDYDRQFTMDGGEISGNETLTSNSNYGGGGVHLSDSSLDRGGSFTMTSGTIKNNRSVSPGGGVYVGYRMAFTMSGGTISGNTADEYKSPWGGGQGGGGGVYCNAGSSTVYGSFTMEDGTISGNTATGTTYGYGGGVYTSGPFVMKNGTISGNTATSVGGGGVYIHNNGATTSPYGFGSLTMKGGTISGNKGADGVKINGGGVYAAGSFSMEAGTISGNTAGLNGGGVYVNHTGSLRGSLAMGNGTISNNTASLNGGGVYTTDYSYLSIPEGSSVSFNTNKAIQVYLLSPDHKANPPVAFVGGVATLSPANINSLNGLTDNAEFNKKSVFNNLDINYAEVGISYYYDSSTLYTTQNSGETTATLTTRGEYGATITTAPTPTPTRLGFTFTGWYTHVTDDTPAGGWKFGAAGTGTDLTVENGVVSYNTLKLYAHWTPATATISYDRNKPSGATGTVSPFSMDSQTATYGQNLTLTKNEFVLNGYTFTGWNTAANGTGTDYVDEQAFTPWQSTTGLKLYAQWKANFYKVIFNGNGNTGGSTADLEMYFDETKTLTPNGFTRTGYTFVSWCTYPNGTGTHYADSQSYKLQTAGGTTLYAEWKARTDSELIFNANGGVAGDITKMTGLSFGQSFTTQSKLLPATGSGAPTRTGYTFAGWSTDSGASNSVNFDNTTTVDWEGSKTVYAVWTANAHKIIFSSNGGTGSMLDLPIDVGQTKNLTANGFSKTGYTFAGWATSAAGGKAYDDKASYTLAVDTDVTLYAVWSANSYKVTFNGNDNTGGSTADLPINFDETKKLTSNGFSKTGYTFDGWSTTKNGDLAYANEADYKLTVAGNVELFARWKANTYTVSYEGNKPSGATGAVSGTMTSQTATYNQNLTLTTNTFSLTGYSFIGWNTAADGKGTSYANGKKFEPWDLTSDLKLYAQWSANSYKLYFNANAVGAALGTSEKSVVFDSAVGTLPDIGSGAPTLAGYTFSGWSETEGSFTTGTGTSNTADFTSAAIVDWTDAGKTVYAVWTTRAPVITGYTGSSVNSEKVLATNTWTNTEVSVQVTDNSEATGIYYLSLYKDAPVIPVWLASGNANSLSRPTAPAFKTFTDEQVTPVYGVMTSTNTSAATELSTHAPYILKIDTTKPLARVQLNTATFGFEERSKDAFNGEPTNYNHANASATENENLSLSGIDIATTKVAVVATGTSPVAGDYVARAAAVLPQVDAYYDVWVITTDIAGNESVPYLQYAHINSAGKDKIDALDFSRGIDQGLITADLLAIQLARATGTYYGGGVIDLRDMLLPTAAHLKAINGLITAGTPGKYELTISTPVVNPHYPDLTTTNITTIWVTIYDHGAGPDGPGYDTTSIFANDFEYGVRKADGSPADAIQDPLARQLSHVIAYNTDGSLQEVSAITVDQTQLKAINDAIAAGTLKTLPLTFTEIEGGKSVIVNVRLYDALGSEVPEAGETYIAADDFEYGLYYSDRTPALALSDDVAKELAHAIARDREGFTQDVSTILVDEGMLDAINDAIKAGEIGIHDLTFTEPVGMKTVTVKVRLFDVVPTVPEMPNTEGETYIAADDFEYGLHYSDGSPAEDFTEVLARELSHVIARTVEGFPQVTSTILVGVDDEFADICAAIDSGTIGNFPLTFTEPLGYKSVTVNVRIFDVIPEVPESPAPEGETYIAADDFEYGLHYSDGTPAEELSPDIAKELSRVVARDIEGFFQDEADITVGVGDELKIINDAIKAGEIGNFPLTFTEPEGGKSVTVNVRIFDVIPPTPGADETYIAADDFEYGIDQPDISKTLAKYLSRVVARDTEGFFQDVSTIVVDAVELAFINAQKNAGIPGSFPLTFTEVLGGKSVTIQVRLYEHGAPAVPDPGRPTISASDFSYGCSQADLNVVRSRILSHVSARDKDGLRIPFTKITVDQGQLEAIVAAQHARMRGFYPLTFSTPEGVSTTITVTLRDYSKPDAPDGRNHIAADDFSVGLDELNITPEQAIDLAATDLRDKDGFPLDLALVIVDEDQLDAINAATVAGETFPSTYAGPGDVAVTVEVTITDNGGGTGRGGSGHIVANDFSYEITQPTLDDLIARTRSAVTATDVNDHWILQEDIAYNAEELDALIAAQNDHQMVTLPLTFYNGYGASTTIKVSLVDSNLYYVSYFSVGHTSGTAPDQTGHSYGQTATIQNQGSLLREGHSLAGWSFNPDSAEVAYQPGAGHTVTGHISLYAVWVINSHDLIYDAGLSDSENDAVTGLPANETGINFGTSVIVGAAPKRQGYSFEGYQSSLGDTLKPEESFSMPDNDVTLTAVWKKDTLIPVGASLTESLKTTPTPEADPSITDAARAEGIPVLDIFGFQIPLVAPSGFAAWSLFDLFATIVCALALIVAAVRSLLRRRKDEEDEQAAATTTRNAVQAASAQAGSEKNDGEGVSRLRPYMLLGALLAVVFAVILFILTQDLSNPPVIFDLYSIVFALVMLFSIVAACTVVHREDDKADEEKDVLQNNQGRAPVLTGGA
ncbi:MAG: InlB B-repeat-containing protein [Coriobacteriales bacterium]|nr:InlB B-repeat-containing protein [Coriobacteriales bacterium]